MPHLEEAQSLLPTGEDVKKRTKRTWDEFSDFALRDNVLEVAVGLMNLDEKFAILRKGPSFVKHGYNTKKQALDDGAVIMLYGKFLSKVLNFIVIALVLFGVARTYGWVTNDAVVKRTVKCKYCRKRISEKAKRCINCTSWQDGREG